MSNGTIRKNAWHSGRNGRSSAPRAGQVTKRDVTSMPISSRTPEGIPNHCPMCGKEVVVNPSIPPGDALCPHCGQLPWFPVGTRSGLSRQHLDVRRLGDVVVVNFTCSQIPDSSIIAELREELRSLVDESKKILLDFANVDYLSSEFLGTLITFDKQAKSASCRVRFCNLRADILEVFQITKLDRLFTIHKDRESALRGFDPLPDTAEPTKLN
ncbi:MAG: STAS domain-containing protein [Planctomycetales bacterium]|nr:STAS domain-containing protein [Planctomycetales bacterium]